MESQKIEQFLAVNGKFFSPESFPQIRTKLASIDDSQETLLMAQDWKNPTVMFIISFFLGGFGVDRFMLGQTGLGIVKFLTCGGAGIWALIDWFTSSKRTKEHNFQQLITRF